MGKRAQMEKGRKSEIQTEREEVREREREVKRALKTGRTQRT